MAPWGHGLLGLTQTYDRSEATLRAMRRQGARIVRLDLDMAAQPDAVERVLDPAIGLCNRMGVEVLVCVAYNPPELGPYHGAPHDPIAWVERARPHVERWAGRVRAYEWWNEPNHVTFWDPPSPRRYVELLRAAWSMQRRADPDSLVISGGTAPVASTGGAYSQLDWTIATHREGAGDFCHALAAHPYPPSNYPPTVDATWNPVVQAGFMAYVSAQFSADRRPKPIWATETGVATGPRGVSEKVQAERLRQLVGMWRRPDWSEWTGPLIWFGLRDSPGLDQPHALAGLQRSDGRPKPAAAAFRELSRTT